MHPYTLCGIFVSLKLYIMQYQYEGTLTVDLGVQQITEKFRKREFVLTTGSERKNEVKFQLINDACQLLDGFSKGDELEVDFEISGTAWTKKGAKEPAYFVNLNAKGIRLVGSEDAADLTEMGDNTFEAEDDLPF